MRERERVCVCVCVASGVEKIYLQVNGCKFNQAQRAEIIGRDGKWEINELFFGHNFQQQQQQQQLNNYTQTNMQ